MMKGKCEDRMAAYAFRCFPQRIDIPVALRDQPVAACETSARLAHVLGRSGIRVLGDLQGRKVGDFARQRNCGLNTLHELDLLVRRVQSLAENASRAENRTYILRLACCAVTQRRRLGKAHAWHRKAGTEARFSIPEPVCELRFDELPTTRRLANVVRSIEARTLGDLNGLSAGELLQCENCYWRTVGEIEQLIERAIAGEFDLAHIEESEAVAELLTLLEQGMAKLSRREKQFLLARIRGLTFAEIGQRFGLTRARAHQVTAKALHVLRKTWGPRVPRLLDMVKRRLSFSNASELTPALLEQWVGESSRRLRLSRQMHVRLIAELDADILLSTKGEFLC
jgi:DNA-directed RNA polymerase specialized sigma24 family protein/predicted nucleic acid-binding Zn ribbon protein